MVTSTSAPPLRALGRGTVNRLAVVGLVVTSFAACARRADDVRETEEARRDVPASPAEDALDELDELERRTDGDGARFRGRSPHHGRVRVQHERVGGAGARRERPELLVEVSKCGNEFPSSVSPFLPWFSLSCRHKMYAGSEVKRPG